MKTIIETRQVFEGNYFDGCFVFELQKSVDGKRFGVINYETVGKNKLKNLKNGDYLSVEAKYKLGPDAILIKEIL